MGYLNHEFGCESRGFRHIFRGSIAASAEIHGWRKRGVSGFFLLILLRVQRNMAGFGHILAVYSRALLLYHTYHHQRYMAGVGHILAVQALFLYLTYNFITCKIGCLL